MQLYWNIFKLSTISELTRISSGQGLMIEFVWIGKYCTNSEDDHKMRLIILDNCAKKANMKRIMKLQNRASNCFRIHRRPKFVTDHFILNSEHKWMVVEWNLFKLRQKLKCTWSTTMARCTLETDYIVVVQAGL